VPTGLQGADGGEVGQGVMLRGLRANRCQHHRRADCGHAYTGMLRGLRANRCQHFTCHAGVTTYLVDAESFTGEKGDTLEARIG